MEELAYFMIRVHRDSTKSLPNVISGVLEHLGTGEKQSFASAEELVCLVSSHLAAPHNMKLPRDRDNPVDLAGSMARLTAIGLGPDS